MASFRYRLQPALDVARAREREALGAFGLVRAAAAALRAECDALETEERGVRVRRAVRETGAVASLLDFEACAERLARLRRDRLVTLARSAPGLAAARASAMRETGRRRALERHRTNALAAWRKGAGLREAAEHNEANNLAQAHGPLARKNVA